MVLTGFSSWRAPWGSWASPGARPTAAKQLDQYLSLLLREQEEGGGAYFGSLRLDLTGTSEGSVNFSHDCGCSSCGETAVGWFNQPSMLLIPSPSLDS